MCTFLTVLRIIYVRSIRMLFFMKIRFGSVIKYLFAISYDCREIVHKVIKLKV
jgi:hypothetical protein